MMIDHEALTCNKHQHTVYFSRETLLMTTVGAVPPTVTKSESHINYDQLSFAAETWLGLIK